MGTLDWSRDASINAFSTSMERPTGNTHLNGHTLSGWLVLGYLSNPEESDLEQHVGQSWRKAIYFLRCGFAYRTRQRRIKGGLVPKSHFTFDLLDLFRREAILAGFHGSLRIAFENAFKVHITGRHPDKVYETEIFMVASELARDSIRKVESQGSYLAPDLLEDGGTSWGMVANWTSIIPSFHPWGCRRFYIGWEWRDDCRSW